MQAVECQGHGYLYCILIFMMRSCIIHFFFLPPVVVIAMLFKSKINIKFYKIFMFTIAGAFVIVYLYRMFIGDGNVVVFEPQNNILFRIIQKLNL